MKLCEVKNILNAKLYTDSDCLQTEVLSACGSDLMSDVLAFVKDQALLLTGLVNAQVVRTAEMMDMKAIVFVRGKKPTEEMIELANDAKIAILGTEYPMYLACGKIYAGGLYNK